MKKTHVKFIIIFGVGYLLLRILDSRHWDIMIYSILLLVIVGSIVQNIHSVIKTSTGIYTDGELVDARNDDKHNEDIEKVIVEFISPVDNLKYQIKSDKRSLNKEIAKGKKIKVWINEHNPHKSLVVKEFNGEFAADLIGSVFFLVVVVLFLLFSIYPGVGPK